MYSSSPTSTPSVPSVSLPSYSLQSSENALISNQAESIKPKKTRGKNNAKPVSLVAKDLFDKLIMFETAVARKNDSLGEPKISMPVLILIITTHELGALGERNLKDYLISSSSLRLKQRLKADNDHDAEKDLIHHYQAVLSILATDSGDQSTSWKEPRVRNVARMTEEEKYCLKTQPMKSHIPKQELDRLKADRAEFTSSNWFATAVGKWRNKLNQIGDQCSFICVTATRCSTGLTTFAVSARDQMDVDTEARAQSAFSKLALEAIFFDSGPFGCNSDAKNHSLAVSVEVLKVRRETKLRRKLEKSNKLSSGKLVEQEIVISAAADEAANESAPTVTPISNLQSTWDPWSLQREQAIVISAAAEEAANESAPTVTPISSLQSTLDPSSLLELGYSLGVMEEKRSKKLKLATVDNHLEDEIPLNALLIKHQQLSFLTKEMSMNISSTELSEISGKLKNVKSKLKSYSGPQKPSISPGKLKRKRKILEEIQNETPIILSDISELIQLPPLGEEIFIGVARDGSRNSIASASSRTLRENPKTVNEPFVPCHELLELAQKFKNFFVTRTEERLKNPNWTAAPHLCGSQFVESELPVMIHKEWKEEIDKKGKNLVKEALKDEDSDISYGFNQCKANSAVFSVCPLAACPVIQSIFNHKAVKNEIKSRSNEPLESVQRDDHHRRSGRKRKATEIMKEFNEGTRKEKQTVELMEETDDDVPLLVLSKSKSATVEAKPKKLGDDWEQLKCQGLEVRCILQPTLMLQEFNRNAKYRPLISVKKLKDVNSGAKYDGFGVFYDGVSVDGGEPQQIPFPAGFPLFEYVGELVFGKKWEDREKHPSINVSS
jgi:hypothetical protein